jgi:hypothetical protein
LTAPRLCCRLGSCVHVETTQQIQKITGLGSWLFAYLGWLSATGAEVEIEFIACRFFFLLFGWSYISKIEIVYIVSIMSSLIFILKASSKIKIVTTSVRRFLFLSNDSSFSLQLNCSKSCPLFFLRGFF